MGGLARKIQPPHLHRLVNPQRRETERQLENDQALVRGDDLQARRLAHEHHRARRQYRGLHDFLCAGKAVLLAKAADQVNVAPRRAAGGERENFRGKIELGVGGAEPVDSIAVDTRGERVAVAGRP